MILEQGLALDELVGTKNSIEREAQGESGGEQSPPAAGAAGRDAVLHHRWNSPMVKAWLHSEKVMFPRNLGSAAAAKVLRSKYSHGQGVLWRVRESCCCTIILGFLRR